ncbi:MAG: Ig-like domain repeat protein [Eubacterium sp.]|nr:Ig-like domain repeat protein [Eubacterium sp.]
MKNNKKGNKSNRPISIRLLALAMAVVMVISVLAVTNRRAKVKADSDYTSGEVSNKAVSFTEGDNTVYSPAKGVKFKLDGYVVKEDTDGTDTTYKNLFKQDDPDEDGDDYVIAEEAPEGYSVYSLDVNISDNIKWFNGSDEIPLRAPSEGDSKFYYIEAGPKTDPVTATLKETKKYFFSGDNYSSLPAEVKNNLPDVETEELATIKINTYEISDITLSSDTTAKTLTLSDPDASYKNNAGEAKYTLYKDGNKVDRYTSVADVNAVLSKKGTDNDGTYKVVKEVYVDGDDLKQIEDFSSEDEESRNFYVLKSFEAGVDGDEMVSGSMETYSVTVPSDGKANPTKDIVINYEVDTATTDVTVSSTGATVDTTNKKITVPGAAANNGATKTYTVTIKQKDSNNNEAVDEFDVNINYGDGTPTIVIDDTSVSVTEDNDPYTINATVGIKDEDSGAKLSGGKIYKLDAPDDTTPEEMSNTVSISESTASVDVNLEPGNNYYMMSVSSDYGLEAKSDVITVFLDDQAPKISAVELSQPTLTWNGGKKTEESTSYKFDNKVSCKDTLDISVTVTDKQSDGKAGSGIDSVTINGEPATYDDNTGVATLSIPSSEANNGTTKNWNIIVTDKAGHDYTASLDFSFFDESAEIEYYEETPQKRTDKDFYIWDDPSAPAASIKVKITSEVQITQVKIDDTVGPKTEYPTGTLVDGKYIYYVTYNFNTSISKENYKIKVIAINKNLANTEKVVAEVRSVDITKPNDITDSTVNDEATYGEDDWAPKVILKVSVSDPGVTSGIGEVKATGTDKSSYTPVNGEFQASVNKSPDTNGTPVTFQVYDKAGNKSDNSWSGKFYVDPDAPKVSLKVDGVDAANVKAHLDRDPVISYSANDALSGLASTGGATLTINGKDYPFDSNKGKKLSDIISSKLDEKTTYTINVSAKDKAGNTAGATCSFRVDGSKPVLTNEIVTTSVKNNNYFNKGVEVSLSVKDSSMEKNRIKVQDANGKTITLAWSRSGDTWSATYKVNAEGKYTVKLSAEDLSGNKDSKSVSFVIDKTKPTLTTQVDGKTYNGKSTFYKKNAETSVVVKDSNEDKSDVSAKITRSPFNGDSDVELSKTGKGPFSLTKDGKYSITYKVTDLAGNTSTKTIGLLIDKTKPLANMYVKTAKPAKFKQFNNTYNNKTGKFTARSDQENYKYGQYYNTNVEIEFNYFEYNPDEIIVYDYNSEDGVETEIEPSWTEGKRGYGKASVTISEEGYHKVRIEVIDEAENAYTDRTAEKTLRFTIDKTAPSIVTVVNGSGYSSNSGIRYLNGPGTVGVSVSDANKDPDDLTRTLKTTAPGGGTSTSVDKVSEGNETFNNDADYEVNYEAIDKAGNKSDVQVVQFRVDRQPPELSITSNASAGTSRTDVTVTFTIKEPFYSDVTSSSIEVYKRVDGSGESHVETINFMPRSGSDSMSKTYTEEGEYRFVFTAEDKTGNKANTDYSFILDGNKPVITLSGVSNYDKTDKNVELGVQVNEKFYLTNNVILSGTRTDIDGKKTNIDLAEFPAHSGPIAALQQLFKEDGIYDITVKSTDRAGNSDEKSIHFTIDTEAPIIKNLSDYDGTTVNAFVWDNDLEKTIRDLTVCNVKVYMDGVEYDGSADLSDGAHTLRVEAVDELGNQTIEEYTFVLDTIEPIIIVNGVEDGTKLKESTDVSITVQLDEDTLDYVKLNGKAVAVTDNTCTYTVDSRGKYTLEAGASDSAGNKASIKYDYVYGTGINWIIVGIVAGVLVLLALAILLIRRRNANS